MTSLPTQLRRALEVDRARENERARYLGMVAENTRLRPLHERLIKAPQMLLGLRNLMASEGKWPHRVREIDEYICELREELGKG